MNNQNVRYFSVRNGSTLDGEFTIQIRPEAFAEVSEQAPLQKIKSDRKFNMRIKQHDVCLLDALSEHEGVSRSLLINKLLHDFLRDELMSMQDKDARALLAVSADERASYDDLASPWVVDAIGKDCKYLLRNILEFNRPHEVMKEPGAPEDAYNSETFIGLREKLKGIQK